VVEHALALFVPAQAQPLGGHDERPAATEEVSHEVSGVGRDFDYPLQEFYWLLCWVVDPFGLVVLGDDGNVPHVIHHLAARIVIVCFVRWHFGFEAIRFAYSAIIEAVVWAFGVS